MKKLILLIAVIFLVEFVSRLVGQTLSAQARTDLALRGVNNAQTEIRVYDTARNYVRPTILAGYVIFAAILFFPRKKTEETNTNTK
jgi:hypothetical protein